MVATFEKITKNERVKCCHLREDSQGGESKGCRFREDNQGVESKVLPPLRR